MNNRTEEESNHFLKKKIKENKSSTTEDKFCTKTKWIIFTVIMCTMLLLGLGGAITYIRISATSVDSTDGSILFDDDPGLVPTETPKNPKSPIPDVTTKIPIDLIEQKPPKTRTKVPELTFGERLQGMWLIKESKNAQQYYKSLGVNVILSAIAAKLKANLNVIIIEDGFNITTVTPIKTVTQTFSFKRNATISNPMTSGEEIVDCEEKRNKWDCKHYHQENKTIIESVQYTLKDNETFQILRKTNIAKVVGRWQFQRATSDI